MWRIFSISNKFFHFFIDDLLKHINQLYISHLFLDGQDKNLFVWVDLSQGQNFQKHIKYATTSGNIV